MADTPGWYMPVGVSLALLSGAFIGLSLILQKKGHIQTKEESLEAGEQHAYLKNPLWWLGMLCMALGEICNFAAYAFAPTILVTPLGAVSVVVSAILSVVFLKEKLNFSGTAGICLCIIGATIIVLHGPHSTATATIPDFMAYVMAPGFLSFSCINFVFVIYMIFTVGPRYGHVHPLVYISVTSIVGAFLVNAAQGFGASILYSLSHWETDNQFLQWPIYPLLAFICVTVFMQVNYLNKALGHFSTSIVTPVYFVFFSTATLIASAVLYQGFKVASVTDGISIILGFSVIVFGVALLFQYNLKINKLQMRLIEDINDADNDDDEEQQNDQNPLKMMAESFPLNPKTRPSRSYQPDSNGAGVGNGDAHARRNDDGAGPSNSSATYVRKDDTAAATHVNMSKTPMSGGDTVGIVQQAAAAAASSSLPMASQPPPIGSTGVASASVGAGTSLVSSIMGSILPPLTLNSTATPALPPIPSSSAVTTSLLASSAPQPSSTVIAVSGPVSSQVPNKVIGSQYYPVAVAAAVAPSSPPLSQQPNANQQQQQQVQYVVMPQLNTTAANTDGDFSDTHPHSSETSDQDDDGEAAVNDNGQSSWIQIPPPPLPLQPVSRPVGGGSGLVQPQSQSLQQQSIQPNSSVSTSSSSSSSMPMPMPVLMQNDRSSVGGQQQQQLAMPFVGVPSTTQQSPSSLQQQQQQQYHHHQQSSVSTSMSSPVAVSPTSVMMASSGVASVSSSSSTSTSPTQVMDPHAVQQQQQQRQQSGSGGVADRPLPPPVWRPVAIGSPRVTEFAAIRGMRPGSAAIMTRMQATQRSPQQQQPQHYTTHSSSSISEDDRASEVTDGSITDDRSTTMPVVQTATLPQGLSLQISHMPQPHMMELVQQSGVDESVATMSTSGMVDESDYGTEGEESLHVQNDGSSSVLGVGVYGSGVTSSRQR